MGVHQGVVEEKVPNPSRGFDLKCPIFFFSKWILGWVRIICIKSACALEAGAWMIFYMLLCELLALMESDGVCGYQFLVDAIALGTED
ncbi:hypothetical protein TNIN_287911 [Trichonephila inaurata madagascariensis]|uniref:Uncharacterized protein n=1 Tax=Trichonephila inaurata madagascariensis TaxID=2747483 RepID=A0A8X7CDU8_9ARAC|nr:hypothetical protein TNIN_287911 [Trichonephila inaurata madagascariensis]